MQDLELAGLAGMFEGIDPGVLAANEGTPLYAYSAPAIRARVRALAPALDEPVCTGCEALLVRRLDARRPVGVRIGYRQDGREHTLDADLALLTIRAAVMPAFRVSPKAVGIGEIIATVAVAATALLVT